MGQIEELPDDFDEFLNLSGQHKSKPGWQQRRQEQEQDASSSAAKAASMVANQAPFPIKEERLQSTDPRAPDLPPAMASIRSYTADELMNMVNKTPLFMTDLENAGDEEGDNVMLDAIRALQNEGTRAEVAFNFREQGNEAAKAKNWRDAKEFYTKGIAVLNAKEDKRETPADLNKEQNMLREAREACYSNRALCNLELKNYRSTTLDCAAALKVNPKNIKAYYRSAMALLALDKIEEAEDASSRGLILDPNNKSLQQVASKIAARKTVLENSATKKRAEEERIRKESQLLSRALQAREIRVRKTDQPPDMEDARVQLTPDPLSPESTLVFPTMFLYPMDAQSDFIKAVSELDRPIDHLEYLFPLPWDSKHEYQPSTVDCYMQTMTGGLIKAGKKLPLLKILSGGKVEVVDDLVKVFVVPTFKAQKWIEEFKSRKQRG